MGELCDITEPGEATLQQELDAFLASAEGDVLLWHDAAGAYGEVVGWLGLPGDVVLVRDDFGSRFDLARRLNDVSPDERVLFYRRHEEVVEPGDWFCDLEARCERFRPTCGAEGVEPAGEPVVAEPEVEEAAPAAFAAEAPAAVEAPVPAVAPVEAAALGEAAPELDKDWYTLEKFVQLAKGRSAESLGFRAYKDCVIRASFAAQGKYYDSLFKDAVVSKAGLDPDLLQAQSFKMYLYQHAQRGLLFDYDEDSWITQTGLKELDIDDAVVDDFVCGALGAAAEAGLECFTVPWLRRQGTGLGLLEYELPDCFYESVLFSCSQCVSSGLLCKRRVFAAKGDGSQGRDLVRAIVSREGSFEADNLVDDLSSVFGIQITRNQLIGLARKAGLFYSPELGRIYKDHQTFVDEVE